MSHEPVKEVEPGLTDAEIKSVQRNSKGRLVYQAAKQIARQMQFEVGDTLVARRSDGKYMEMPGGVLQKWRVVHKCEAGLIYGKKILAGGKLGVGCDLLATYHDGFVFELDPNQADAILTGQEENYNPSAEAKEIKRKRDKQRRLNKALKITCKTLKEGENILQAMKPSESYVYRSSTLADGDFDEFQVIKVETKPVELPQKNMWGMHSYSRHQGYIDEGLTHYTSVELQHMNHAQGGYKYSNRTITAEDFIRSYQNWYLTKPWRTEEVK